MSLPPPVTVHVLPDRLCPPGPGVTWPMSAQFHPVGHSPGGSNSPGVRVTVSSVTVEPAFTLCDVIAKPASSDPGMLSTCVEPGIAVHVFPSGDV